MTDKSDTLLDFAEIIDAGDRLCSWANSVSDSRPLFIFWTSYSRPSIGGTQKRTATLADKLAKHASVAFVHIRDDFGTGPGYPSFCFGSNGISGDAPAAIVRAISASRAPKAFVYVDHVNYFDHDVQIASLQDLNEAADQVFFLMASERTARLVHEHASSVPVDGVRLHCLNNHTYTLLAGAKLPTIRVEQFEEPRDTLHFGHNQPLVCSGRVVKEKNILALIEAWTDLHDVVKGQARLDLWGPVVDDYGKRVLVEINRSGDESLRYRGVYNCPKDSPLRTANALVHTSLTEGASNVVVEAMAFGKPVIGSAIEGVGNLLPGQEFQINAPFGPEEIRHALETYLTHTADIETYRAVSRVHAEYQRIHYARDEEFERILPHLLVNAAPMNAA